MKRIRAFAPATVANVCCGFDVLGFAVDSPEDEVIITLRNNPGISIKRITGDDGRLDLDPQKNTAGVAVQSYLNQLGSNQGVDIELIKGLPMGSGMGSSGASAVAALVGVSHLLGEPVRREDLVIHAMEAEHVACGAAHGDNVAAALLGGFVLIRSYTPLDIVKVPSPPDLYCTLIHPHLELKTKDSRRVLRESIALKDTITQSGNIAALMIGLIQHDFDLISRSLVDVIAEPVRSVFIPGFNEIKGKVKDSGALGLGISGSGPTIFALCKDQATAEIAGAIAADHFRKLQLMSDVYISRINQKGARVS